jgi:hypothetical protein
MNWMLMVRRITEDCKGSRRWITGSTVTMAGGISDTELPTVSRSADTIVDNDQVC